MTPIQQVGLWAIVIFWAGLVSGVAITFLLLREGLAMGARMQRTGRPASAGAVAPVVAGGEFKDRPHGASVEYQSAEKALAAVIDRGADEIMSLEPNLSRKEARAKAKRILEETGAFNVTGGIPSP